MHGAGATHLGQQPDAVGLGQTFHQTDGSEVAAGVTVAAEGVDGGRQRRCHGGRGGGVRTLSSGAGGTGHSGFSHCVHAATTHTRTHARVKKGTVFSESAYMSETANLTLLFFFFFM